MYQEKKTIPERSCSLVDKNNVLYSPYDDLDLPIIDIHLHEFIWQNVDKHWNKAATICSATGRSYTYSQLRKSSGRFATSLRQLGLKPGDLIASIFPNIPEFVMLLMGASEAGIQLILINSMYTPNEMAKLLSSSEAKAVVTVSSKFQVVAESINGIDSIQYPMIVFDDGISPSPTGTINFMDLVAEDVTEFKKTGKKTETNAAIDTVILPFSSGTTGIPKGVELTHRNIVANLMQLERTSFLKPAELVANNSQDVYSLFSPVFHMAGVFTLSSSLRRGAKTILISNFTSDVLLKVMNDYKITMFPCVPLILQLITNDKRFTKKHRESIERISCGAAPLGEAVITKFEEKFGESFINQLYGLTEASCLVTCPLGKDSPIGSVGYPVSSTQIRIIGLAGENCGKNLGINEIGEIWIKGPQVMKGYYKNPKATLDTMNGEWLKTGDLGRFDDTGNLWITGRLKELIKVKGWQVAPAEIEDILHAHENIADVAVIGVPHKQFGEIPKAFVVLKKEKNVSEMEIKNFVSQRVISYKKLGHVVFINEIPKNPSGKILRNKLRDMYTEKSKL